MLVVLQFMNRAISTSYFILHRLSHHFGINNAVLSWFRSYLNNRSHCVDVNNNISRSFQLFFGVPQGSVLAPILFTLYIKPLTSIISKFGFSFHFYADDVQFYVTFDADKTLDANLLTKCLKAVEQWLCCNKLKLNKVFCLVVLANNLVLLQMRSVLLIFLRLCPFVLKILEFC